MLGVLLPPAAIWAIVILLVIGSDPGGLADGTAAGADAAGRGVLAIVPGLLLLLALMTPPRLEGSYA